MQTSQTLEKHYFAGPLNKTQETKELQRIIEKLILEFDNNEIQLNLKENWIYTDYILTEPDGKKTNISDLLRKADLTHISFTPEVITGYRFLFDTGVTQCEMACKKLKDCPQPKNIFTTPKKSLFENNLSAENLSTGKKKLYGSILLHAIP